MWRLWMAAMDASRGRRDLDLQMSTVAHSANGPCRGCSGSIPVRLAERNSEILEAALTVSHLLESRHTDCGRGVGTAGDASVCIKGSVPAREDPQGAVCEHRQILLRSDRS
jgi:hypothetical protein